jgi:hypothetical protein
MRRLGSLVLGIGLVGGGLISLAVWLFRVFNPTAEDRARLDIMAEHGGVEATAPADPKKIYLLGGAAAVAAGSGLIGTGARRWGRT